MLGGNRLRLLVLLHLTPLYGLMASRYRRGDAVTAAPAERDFSFVL